MNSRVRMQNKRSFRSPASWSRLCIVVLLSSGLLGPLGGLGQCDDWAVAEENGRKSQQAIKFCNRYAQGWLAQADPVSGLLPRTTQGQRYWNAKDCAADNFPFIVLTAHVTDNYYLKRAAQHILEQEQRLTNRLDSLPDDFLFDTQSLKGNTHDLGALIFGASEYAKDGLMPITEWIGPGPWLTRMNGLVRDIWKHAATETEVGLLPSLNVEVGGELLQTMSRLYWLNDDDQYREWIFRLADYFLLQESLLAKDSLRLRDHGCEIIGGLSEAYVIAAKEDPQRREKFRIALHAILDRILEVGVNQDGMMHNGVNPRTGAVAGEGLSDGWGYVYNAFLTVAMIDGTERYEKSVAHALANIHKYRNYAWEGADGADGFADSIEGAINLLNRIPVASAFAWVDEEILHIFEKQRHDGIIEGWYGDGNSARTAIMWALLKTQGVTLAPWREDLRLGAVKRSDGSLMIRIESEWAWSGKLRFDRPRHRDYFRLPLDYPRINQFPEWFTADQGTRYEVRVGDEDPREVKGEDLWQLELNLKGGEVLQINVHPVAQ